MYEYTSDTPRCIEKNYKKKYTAKIFIDSEGDYWKVYKGTGIKVDEHPYKDRCHMEEKCGVCGCSNVEVIFAHWSVNVATGDAKVGYELHCKDCNKYTTRGMDD